MTDTNSLYQLLSLFETARKAGHHTRAIEDGILVGWYDEDTCFGIRIHHDDFCPILGRGSAGAVQIRHIEDRQLCLKSFGKALWASYTALLATPAGRARLFAGDQDDPR